MDLYAEYICDRGQKKEMAPKTLLVTATATEKLKEQESNLW